MLESSSCDREKTANEMKKIMLIKKKKKERGLCVHGKGIGDCVKRQWRPSIRRVCVLVWTLCQCTWVPVNACMCVCKSKERAPASNTARDRRSSWQSESVKENIDGGCGCVMAWHANIDTHESYLQRERERASRKKNSEWWRIRRNTRHTRCDNVHTLLLDLLLLLPLSPCILSTPETCSIQINHFALT